MSGRDKEKSENEAREWVSSSALGWMWMLLFACLFNAPDPNQFQTLKSLTTERWRLRRWPCFCGLSPSGWKRHEPRWKRSWAQAWSTPAWLSERTSTFSAECAALQGRPVVTILEIFSSEGWEGSWSRERISTFPNIPLHFQSSKTWNE